MAFRSIKSLSYCRGLSGAPDNPRQYERDLIDLKAITYEYEGETYTAEHYFKKQNIIGLMILDDSKVVVEKYDQGITADTTYMIMSSTKSFTATMVGIAIPTMVAVKLLVEDIII